MKGQSGERANDLLGCMLLERAQHPAFGKTPRERTRDEGFKRPWKMLAA